MEACVADYVVLGEIGKQISDGLEYIQADKIELGMRDLAYTEYMKGALAGLVNLDVTDDSIKFVIDEVPVTIILLHNDYEFMKNPDKQFHSVETFNLPNPFNKYWKIRGLIG